MKITQNQNNNLLIIRFLCKFALRTTVQIVEGLRQNAMSEQSKKWLRTTVQIVEGLRQIDFFTSHTANA